MATRNGSRDRGEDRPRRPGRWIAAAALLLLAPPARALVPRGAETARDPRRIEPALARARAERLDPDEASPAGRRAREFLARHDGRWLFEIDRRTDRPTLVQGAGIPLVAASRVSSTALERAARRFIAAEREWLEPPCGELVLDPTGSLVRDAGRLASLRFQWFVDGVPVDGAGVFLRLHAGRLTQFGSALVGGAVPETRPAIPADRAWSRLLDHAGHAESHVPVGGPELRLQPEADGTELTYRLVWRLAFRVPGRRERFEGRVDARTGEVVGFGDSNLYGRVFGGVYPRTVFEQNETRAPLPFVVVGIGEESAATDSAGGFAFAGETLSSTLDGPWFGTTCQGCSGPAQPRAVAILGAGILDFGLGGADQVGNGSSTPADRNAFYHLNQVRRAARKWLPALAWMSGTVAANVNIADTCNAFWDGAVNFFRSGGGCNNSGEIADIIYHEWGHGLDLNTLPGDGATGEGTADVVSMHLTHSAVVGPGFETDGTPVRNLDPAGPRGLLTTANIASKCPPIGTRGPLGYEVHCEGEIYGQTAWDLAQALVARHGHQTGWRVSERLFFTSLPDAGGYLAAAASPIYAAYLFADDDDGDLANGTPHAAEIFAAFDRHGIAGSPLPATPHCARPAQPVVVLTPRCDRIDLSWLPVAGAVRYEILRGELRGDQALYSLGSVAAPATTFADGQVAPATDAWYVVMAVGADGCESTIENPLPARRLPQPVLSAASVVADDFPRGNRSGFPDPDEEVDLVVALANLGDAPATGLAGTLEPSSAIEILDGQADWPTIDPGTVAANQDVLRFRADSATHACGELIEFRLDAVESSGCSADSSWFRVELGFQGTCDSTPACYVPPTFAGLANAGPGASCAEADIDWAPGQSNCINASIRYDVYRGLDASFVPGPDTLIAERIQGTSYHDTLLEPGRGYHYLVRAYDSRSGEDGNLVRREVIAPTGPDLGPPQFSGLATATSGAGCGTVELAWPVAAETCNRPVSYAVYRSTAVDFTPGPASLVGVSLSTSYADAGLAAGTPYTYVVRARDAAGNEDPNTRRLGASAGITDRIVFDSGFEAGSEGWSVVGPNSATTGTWEWGDPEGAGGQTEDCAGGSLCWITGLAAALPDGSNNDVDGGATTLQSPAYDLRGTTAPELEYARWFSNDRGTNGGQDPGYVEISDDGGSSWVGLEQVSGGTPLDWVLVRRGLPSGIAPGADVRVRFLVSDTGGGSLVEAGLDDVRWLDADQGCVGCATPVPTVGTIRAVRQGDDVLLDWTTDPVPGERFAVYVVSGPSFADALRVGTTANRAFVHEGAALASESFYYRVSALDACGNESALE